MSEEYEEIEELGDEEEEEEDYEEDSKNTALMDQSGQTDEDRRKIRREQRALFKDMEEKQDLQLEEARGRNNKIFNSVRFTREAVLDGENLNMIATKAAQKADSLMEVPRYDADRLISKLVQLCKSPDGGFFDWAMLGKEAGTCFNSVPSCVSFLNGPLTNGKELEVKQRKERKKRVVEESDAEEEHAEDVKTNTAKDADQLSAIESSMKVLHKTLKKRVNDTYQKNKRHLQETYDGEIPKPVEKKFKKYGHEICGIKYLFNPKSFTQTVENIFHFAFLIKNQQAAMSVREKGFGEHIGQESEPGLKVKYVDANTKKKPPPPRQTIVSLTMRDYRALIEANDVTEGDLPHRTGSKHAKRARTQSQLSQS